MQDASDAFETAVATHRAWMPPRLRTDWAGNGYDGNRTIDDLSPQISEDWAVTHSLDDGYPSVVGFVSGVGVPELTTELAGRAVDGVPVTAPAYWSPLRADSPVYGYDRDIAPVTLDVGLITDDGPEYVRVFTGQMTDTPLRRGVVSLETMSAARLDLMRPVMPPAFPASQAGGLRGCWLVSWALYACGLYAGPLPRAGSTVLYFPMHGSMWRFPDCGFTDGNALSSAERWQVFEVTPATSPGDFIYEVDWLPGPYVAAPGLGLTAARSRRAYQIMPEFDRSAGQADAFSQAGNKGRFEAWVRGDAADVNNAPGGSATVSRLVGVQLQVTGGSGPRVELGVNTSRQVYAIVYDGTNTRTLVSASTLATDGAWHFVGAAYDMTADKLWVNLDGTVGSSSTSMATSALPAADAFYETGTFVLSYLPVSDLTFSTGSEANVDSFPLWRNDASFAPTARVHLSQNKLAASGEIAPVEAWALISRLAQADVAATRPDEVDEVQYLPPGWWVQDAQQLVTDLHATDSNAAAFDIDQDPTRIRNAITVRYTERATPDQSVVTETWREMFALPSGTEIVVPPGITELRCPLSSVTAAQVFQGVSVLNGTDALATRSITPYITLNLALDGTNATYATLADILIEIIAWNAGAITLRITNYSASTWYAANDDNVPALTLWGIPVTAADAYATDIDATSVAARGQRVLEVTADGIQTSVSARRLARLLKSNLRRPVITVGSEQGGVMVTGNPRRQPGDLVTLSDSVTGVQDGLWRLQSVRHAMDGAAYTQEVITRRVFPLCVVGESIVGHSLVGPNAPDVPAF